MEKMPYQPHLEHTLPLSDQTSPAVASDWRTGLPCLTGNLISLRELRSSEVFMMLGDCVLPIIGGLIAKAAFNANPQWDAGTGRPRP